MRILLRIAASRASLWDWAKPFSSCPATMRATLRIALSSWFVFVPVPTLAQGHSHGGVDNSATKTGNSEQSDAIEGILVDALWFAEDEPGKAEKIARASKRLADGGPAALLPAGAQQSQDLLYILTSSAVLAPYAGATIKVEGPLLADVRAIRPAALYVRDDGKWREVQLKPEQQKSAAEPQLLETGAAAHEHPPSHGADGHAGPAHEVSPAAPSAEHEHDEGQPTGRTHQHWIELPPAHPLLVNFTAGLFPAAVLADWLGRLLRRQSLRSAAWWMLLFAAVVTPFTALAGWAWYREVGDMGHWQMSIHPWLGTSLAFLVPALAFWRGRIQRRGIDVGMAYLLIATLALAAVVAQGHLGATMSFVSEHPDSAASHTH